MPTLFKWGRRSLSRRVMFSAMFALLVIMGGATALMLRGTSPRPAEGKPIATAAKTAERDSALSNRDDDGDGLQNWEEALYRADPANPDSDGDGTPDGQEVRENRDPAKKGPPDPLDQPPVNDAIADQAASDPQNLTFNLTQQLLASGVLNAINKKGEVTDAGFLDRLQLPAELDPSVMLERAATITARDLTIMPDSDAPAVKRYFNAVYAVYTTHLGPLPRNDLEVFTAAVEQEDYGTLAELDPIIAALERSVAEIRRMPVPAGYEGFAVTELNHLLKTKRAIEVLRRLPEDPLAALIVLRERTKLYEEIERATAQTKVLLAAQNIMFTPADGASNIFSQP